MINILLIEDDDVLRGYLADGLIQAGHHVIEAQSGNEGLRLFKQNAPEMIITDLVMDDGEGIESILSVRKLAPSIPLIAISGNALYLESSKKLGADKVMEKPFTMTELLTCIRQFVAQT